MSIFPKKLRRGSHIRVIAPSRSFKIISEETRSIALKRFEELGIKVSYSKHSDEINDFVSSPANSKVDDIHEAFADKSVDAIFTAIGGFNSNEILDYLDYDLIKKNPKILCGFSDITALTTAIYAKTGLVTYSGPHFSSLGMKKGCEYTVESLIKCLVEEDSFEISASKEWSDDAWFMDQEKRDFIKNEGHWLINKGKKDVVEGKIIGGNLSTLAILQGTEYMPNIQNSILFIEDNFMTSVDDLEFSRRLTSLTQQENFKDIKAVVIGRFQKESNISRERISSILLGKEKLKDLPIIANVDFGHTTPIITFPVGGTAKISWNGYNYNIEVIKH